LPDPAQDAPHANLPASATRYHALPGPSFTHRIVRRPEKFAALVERHWDGIAAYCKPENKVALGFVEGLNNKIRVVQRRAYGLRDEEYLRLKVLTMMLPAI
jgi:hypothetical protein